MSLKVLIIGAGAIGAFYGALLAKAGASVSVVCRNDFAVVRQQGFVIQSAVLGDWQFRPEQVLHNTADFVGTPDYVLLCTKVLPTQDRCALLKPAVKADTAIVFIQNGIDIEPEIQAAFPAHEHPEE